MQTIFRVNTPFSVKSTAVNCFFSVSTVLPSNICKFAFFTVVANLYITCIFVLFSLKSQNWAALIGCWDYACSNITLASDWMLVVGAFARNAEKIDKILHSYPDCRCKNGPSVVKYLRSTSNSDNLQITYRIWLQIKKSELKSLSNMLI